MVGWEVGKLLWIGWLEKAFLRGDRGNNMCEGPVVEMNLASSRKGKKGQCGWSNQSEREKDEDMG